jgi:hypothetical protein
VRLTVPSGFRAPTTEADIEVLVRSPAPVVGGRRRPDAAVIAVTDDAGTDLDNVALIICQLAPDGSTCAANSFDGPDPDGVLRLDDVDPATTYRITASLTNSGWPCPSYTDPVTGECGP